MADLLEALHRRAGDALGRRFRRDEFGVGGFQRLQFAQQPVVLGVRDLRVVEHVIAVVVVIDLVPELANALGGRVHRPGMLGPRMSSIHDVFEHIDFASIWYPTPTKFS